MGGGRSVLAVRPLPFCHSSGRVSEQVPRPAFCVYDVMELGGLAGAVLVRFPVGRGGAVGVVLVLIPTLFWVD